MSATHQSSKSRKTYAVLLILSLSPHFRSLSELFFHVRCPLLCRLPFVLHLLTPRFNCAEVISNAFGLFIVLLQKLLLFCKSISQNFDRFFVVLGSLPLSLDL